MNRTSSGRVLNCQINFAHFAKKPRVMACSNLPDTFDPRDKDTPIFDQGQQGSCTMNAGCGMYDFMMKQKGKDLVTSRDFGYWCERMLDGDVDQDAGSSLQTCGQVWTQTGVCLESFDQYDDDDLFAHPSAAAFKNALNYRVKEAIMLNQDAISIKSALFNGQPVGIGMAVYQSFEDTDFSGLVRMPDIDESLLGGHALAIVGYEKIDDKTYYITRNSWGTEWGESGYCYLPEEMVLESQLVSDLMVFEV